MPKLFLSLIFCLLFLIRFEAYAKSPPAGTGFQDVPANVYILLDTSASMDISVLAGDAKYASDVAFDSNNNMYVSSRIPSIINKYDSNGNFLRIHGAKGGLGTPNKGYFNSIFAVETMIRDGKEYLLVTDEYDGALEIMNISTGVFESSITLADEEQAYGIAVDSNNTIYVASTDGDIELFEYNGIKLKKKTPAAEWDLSSVKVKYLASYVDPATSIEYIFASSPTNKKILVLNTSGLIIKTFDLSFTPAGLTLDNNGNLYVANSQGSNHKIYKLNSLDGSVISSSGSTQGGALGKFNQILNLATDNAGEIWAADSYNHRIQKYDGSEVVPAVSFTRIGQAKKIIKDLVSNSALTAGANFGLIQWNSNASVFVTLSSTGAAEIYNTIDDISPTGSTKLRNGLSVAKTSLQSLGIIGSDVSCANTLLIVISDGEWDDNPDSLAAELAGLGVQTFAVGFSVESSSSASAKYISLSQSAGTYPTSPIFTDSAQTVYESISDYILQNLSSTLTFSAPTIMPEVSGDDYIVQATFKYKTNHQWKGHLNKYDLNADGNIGSIQWDAGEKLAAKKAKNRKIWTVGDNLALDEDYNNFTTDNLNALEPLLLENNTASYLGEEESNEDNLKNLIDFVRGVDVYGEFSGGVDDEGDKIIEGERWKLADIYHSRAVVVGVPDAFSSKDSAANTESYYRYSYGYDSFKTDNVTTRDTVVYVGSNGGMLHAFDAETGEEKWAFVMPGLIPNLKDMISTVSGESVSIFGVDGSPVAKDIFVNGAWKTILIVGSAQGGKTYSILDITDPENPGHIFSFAHNSITEMVIIWDENGQRTEYSTDPEISSIPDAYDFSKLGEAWSNPLILRLPVGAEGAMRWVALFGGGFNAGISTEYGAQLYILDLEDGGKIIKNLNISDDDSSDGVENSVPARLMAVTPDSSTQFQGDDDPSGAVIYFSDLEGKLWKINLTTQGQLYQFAQLFDAETTASNARLSFHEITATLDDDGNLWQYYGTGDVLSLGDVSSSIANRGYGYRHITPMTDFSQSAMDTVSSPFMANVGLNECPQPPTGWFIDLDPNEKITAKASIANGYVYFSRYTSNADDICTAGTAKVTEHDYVCGNVITEFDLGTGVPTETLVYNNKIYLGISTDQVSANLPEGWTKVGNLLTATVTNPSFGSVNVESWWEER